MGGRTGTMDDSETTKGIWRELIGSTFIKLWKKQKITSKNVIQKYESNDSNESNESTNDDDVPYIDISITNNSAVRAGDFRESLCKNPIIQLSIDQNTKLSNESINPYPTNPTNSEENIN